MEKWTKKIGINNAARLRNRLQNNAASLLSVLKPRNKPRPHNPTERPTRLQIVFRLFLGGIKYITIAQIELLMQANNPDIAKLFIFYGLQESDNSHI
jgi:hypothetical protein